MISFVNMHFSFSMSKKLPKQRGRFGIGFSKKYDIFEVPIKHPLHGWFEVELLINVMIFVNSLIYKKIHKKCSISLRYAHCLHIIKNNEKKCLYYLKDLDQP